MFICKRVFNKRTNLGNRYFENIYIITVSNKKLNVTWFIKKNGINCGIFNYYCLIQSFMYHYSLMSKVCS